MPEKTSNHGCDAENELSQPVNASSWCGSFEIFTRKSVCVIAIRYLLTPKADASQIWRRTLESGISQGPRAKNSAMPPCPFFEIAYSPLPKVSHSKLRKFSCVLISSMAGKVRADRAERM